MSTNLIALLREKVNLFHQFTPYGMLLRFFSPLLYKRFDFSKCKWNRSHLVLQVSKIKYKYIFSFYNKVLNVIVK